MSDVSVEQMAEEIVKIEERAIQKKLDVFSSKEKVFGKAKIDADAVNKILAVLDAGGVEDEN